MTGEQHLIRIGSRLAIAIVRGAAILCLIWQSGCASYNHDDTIHQGPELASLASFDSTVSGVAATSEGRVFVSLPDLWTRPDHAVVEVTGGVRKPYPDASWNGWTRASNLAVDRSWVGVTAMCIDPDGVSLWVLDSGSVGWSAKRIDGAAKLVEIDLESNRVKAVYDLGEAVVKNGVFNDVRIDSDRRRAVISDSGVGRIIVVDLSSRQIGARLVASEATKAQDGYVVRIGGRPWRALFGVEPEVHVNGIAVDDANGYLYFHALTAPTLYRVPLDSLFDPDVSDSELDDAVFAVAHTGATDGMAIGPDGHLYWTALELDAIERLSPAGRDVVVRDRQIQWPDNLVLVRDPDGNVQMYFTVAMMHLEWPFNCLFTVTDQPYQLFRVTVPDVPGVARLPTP